ncbi:hypothetical protein LZ554_002750 [Drepanopeziza brunnea f. sp. 'monogermtubi']|nr:hypothetical protein LZ554_002750 [Drepanopeziza brunnea f. sp. 'monogermtubi']
MQLGLNRRYLTLGGAGILALWLWSSLGGEGELPKNVQWAIGRPISTPENDVYDFPLLDSWQLQDICSSVEWNSSLVFTCDENRGGIGHVRNSILNCVRYAIGAGGALVLPSIALREMDDMEPGNSHEDGDGNGNKDGVEAEMQTDFKAQRRNGRGRMGLDYMFDKNHFVDSLRKSCPELLLIRHMEQTTSKRRRNLLPENLFENLPVGGIERPETWSDKLNVWIDKSMAAEPAAEPIIIDLEQSFLHYPTHSDDRELAHHFGHILKFRPDIRRLATKILKELSQWHEMQYFNLSEPIINPSFIGVHLGTENPLGPEKRHVVDVTYSHYKAQAAAYIEQATTSRIPIMYVASGRYPDIVKLAAEAKEWSVAVTYKEDLLRGKWKEELDRLKWDQRALVDYLVLLKGQEFAGIGHSSFSWNVMLKRHDMGDDGVRMTLVQPGTYQDSFSKLYGVRKSYVESAGCMWP